MKTVKPDLSLTDLYEQFPILREEQVFPSQSQLSLRGQISNPPILILLNYWVITGTIYVSGDRLRDRRFPAPPR